METDQLVQVIVSFFKIYPFIKTVTNSIPRNRGCKFMVTLNNKEEINDRDKYDSLPVTGYSPGKSQILIIINSYKPREMSGLLNTACHSQELM